MEVAKLNRVGSFPQLVGYWQFSAVSNHYLAVVENASSPAMTVYRVYKLNGEDWTSVKAIYTEPEGAVSVDGRVIGAKIYICNEVNRREPLQLLSAEIGEFVQPGTSEVEFTPVARLRLTEDQLRKIDLPVGSSWSTPPPLRPSEWLFAARLVGGRSDRPEVVVNTADAQVAILSPVPGAAGILPIGEALEPQALESDGQRYVAFKKIEDERRYPFWLLPGYSGSHSALAGDLILVAAGGAPQNLSLDLNIGGVTRFALVSGEDGRPWVFALHDAAVGTEVWAIERSEAGWVVRGQSVLEVEALRISAYPRLGVWHLVYGSEGESGWVLDHQVWRVPG